MNIGKSIRVARAMYDMSQRDLSEASDISTVTISKLSTGKAQLKQHHLETFCEVFNMPASEFIALGE